MFIAAQVFDVQSLKNFGKEACGGPVPATYNVLKHYVDFVTGLALGNDDVSSQPFSSFLSGVVLGAEEKKKKGFLQRLTGR